jgi:hypothetical protein
MDDYIKRVDLTSAPAAARAVAPAAAQAQAQAPPAAAASTAAASASTRPSNSTTFIEVLSTSDGESIMPIWEIKTEVYRKIIKVDDFKNIKDPQLVASPPPAPPAEGRNSPALLQANAAGVSPTPPSAAANTGRSSPTLLSAQRQRPNSTTQRNSSSAGVGFSN